MAEQWTTEAPLPRPADLAAVLAAERTGVPFLYWRRDDGAQEILMLPPERDRVTVGRRSSSDVALPWDLEVSRTHALLDCVSGEWTVVDDGLSRNGSYVNGGRVLGRQRLHDRDRLCFGRTHVVFREPPQPDEGASTARALGNSNAVPLSETQRKVLIALCRPVADSPYAPPATNKDIAEELYLSVEAVKAHLRVLFERFGIGDLPQNEKRARLAARALLDGVIQPREL